MKNKPQCTITPPLTDDEILAIKALWKGNATEYQQRLSLKVIVNKLARADDLLFIPGSFDETAFLQGRGFVGQQVMKYLNLPLNKLEGAKDDNQ